MVSRIPHRHGVQIRRTSLSADVINEAARLYQNGWVAKIGEQLGASADTVRLRLIEQGVKSETTRSKAAVTQILSVSSPPKCLSYDPIGAENRDPMRAADAPECGPTRAGTNGA